MNNQTIIKQYDKGNQMISFLLTGEEKKENIDYNKLNNLADSCFNKMVNFTDVIKNISYIRTIYKDLKETDLTITVTTLGKNSENTVVTYRKEELEEYKHFGQPNTKFTKYGFIFTYSKQNGINISSPKKQELEKVKNLINNEMNQLKELENVMPITLNHDSTLLCEIYKLFYNELPDFSEKEINLKIQTMMCILSEFGITLENYSNFQVYSDSKFPISINLSYLVDKLTPLGKINKIEEPVPLSEEAIKEIRTIGQTITSSTNDIEEVMKISRILYDKTHRLSSSASIEEMSEFTKCSSEEVKNTIQLVKKIEDNLYKF